MKKPLLISFSGGRTSAYMTWLLLNSHTHTHTSYLDEYQPYVVFANTGCEHPKTLDFVNNCATHFGWDVVWLEAKVNHAHRVGTGYTEVDYFTASLKGEPYAEVIKKYGIANITMPHCTRELKLAPIRAWCRDKFGTAIIDTAIGIRADETKRIKPESADKNKLHYPLAEWGIDKQDVMDFWAEQEFDLDLPEHLGNCVWCFKKTDTKLLKALAEYPVAFEFPKRMEKEHPNDKRGNVVKIFRKRRSVSDLESLLNVTGIPPEQQIQEGGCSESCEFISALDEDE